MECGLALNMMVVLEGEPFMNKLGHCLTVSCIKPFQHQSKCGPIYHVFRRITPFIFSKQVIKVGLLGSCGMQGVLEALDNTLVVDA